MSGNYTIGGGASDFTTIQEACDSLEAQGVNGAVTLDIADGLYLENISLYDVIGVSTTNTITFQSASATAANVTITSTGSSFNLSTPHVIIKNLTLSSGTYAIYSDTGYFEIDGCDVSSVNTCLYFYSYISSGGSKIENVTIKNSLFNGNFGLTIYAETISNITSTNTNYLTTNNCLNIYADFFINNISISKGSINSLNGYAVNIEGELNGVESITLDSLTVKSRYNSIDISSNDHVLNTNISNVSITGESPTYNYRGINIYGGINNLENITLSKVQTDSVYYGFYLSSDGESKNIAIDSAMITSSYRGIYFTNNYGNVNNLNISNAIIESETSSGIYLYCSETNNNLTLNNVTSSSEDREGGYITGLNLSNATISHCNFKGDSTNTGDEGLYINIDKNINNLNISNSNFISGKGLYVRSYRDFTDIILDSVYARSNYNGGSSSGYGAHIEVGSGVGVNTNIRNSTFVSDTGYAAYIGGSDGQLNYVTVLNSTFNAARTYGLYMYSYAGLENVYIKKSSFTCGGSYGYALYLQNYYNRLYNVLIDSCDATSHNTGIYLEGLYNQGSEKINISNNNITVDLNGFSGSSGYGITSYSDGAINNFNITNNNIKIANNYSGQGVYLGAYGSGVKNTVVDNNTILLDGTGSTGIMLEYAAENIMVGNNIIDTNGNSNYIDYGLYITGEYNFTNNVVIENNSVHNAYYGLYAEYSLSNVTIKNNYFVDESNSGGYGTYIWDVRPGKFELTGNTFTSYDGSLGLEFQDVNLDTVNKGLVANNFIGNFAEGLSIEATRNVLFTNNSFSSSQNSSPIYFDEQNKNIEFYNNIVNVDSSSFTGYLIEFEEPGIFKGMDYNVYNIDTAKANLVYDGWYGNTYQSLADWNAYSGFDGASFMEDVVFVNDTFDLHIECSNTSLVAGMSVSQVTTDIDGNIRATTPTIGADEILTSGENIFSQTNIDARSYSSYTLDAGASSGAVSYLWNTGETTQMISVDSNAWYRVTITDDCGSYTDSVYVEVGGYASIKEANNELAASLFPNPSNGEFTLQVNGKNVEEFNLKVLSISGQLIYQSTIKNGKQQKLNITNQPNGVYFIHLTSNKGASVLKVVKQ